MYPFLAIKLGHYIIHTIVCMLYKLSSLRIGKRVNLSFVGSTPGTNNTILFLNYWLVGARYLARDKLDKTTEDSGSARPTSNPTVPSLEFANPTLIHHFHIYFHYKLCFLYKFFIRCNYNLLVREHQLIEINLNWT